LFIENEKSVIRLFYSKNPQKVLFFSVDSQKSSGYNDRQQAGQKDGIHGSRIISTITEYGQVNVSIGFFEQINGRVYGGIVFRVGDEIIEIDTPLKLFS
jgi:hypothetical protein